MRAAGSSSSDSRSEDPTQRANAFFNGCRQRIVTENSADSHPSVDDIRPRPIENIQSKIPSRPLANRVSFIQPHRAAVGRLNDQVQRQAELLVDGRGDVIGEVFVANRTFALVIGGSDD